MTIPPNIVEPHVSVGGLLVCGVPVALESPPVFQIVVSVVMILDIAIDVVSLLIISQLWPDVIRIFGFDQDFNLGFRIMC